MRTNTTRYVLGITLLSPSRVLLSSEEHSPLSARVEHTPRHLPCRLAARLLVTARAAIAGAGATAAALLAFLAPLPLPSIVVALSGLRLYYLVEILRRRAGLASLLRRSSSDGHRLIIIQMHD